MSEKFAHSFSQKILMLLFFLFNYYFFFIYLVIFYCSRIIMKSLILLNGIIKQKCCTNQTCFLKTGNMCNVSENADLITASHKL